MTAILSFPPLPVILRWPFADVHVAGLPPMKVSSASTWPESIFKRPVCSAKRMR